MTNVKSIQRELKLIIYRVNLYREYTCFLYPPYLFIVLILTPFLTGVANRKKQRNRSLAIPLITIK